MDILHGVLESTKNTLQISTPSGNFHLWSLIEPTFWSLCGHHVFPKKDVLSVSLALDGDTDWVFHYKSREIMFLVRRGGGDYIDFGIYFKDVLLRLNGRTVVVEADNEHFKIFADTSAA